MSDIQPKPLVNLGVLKIWAAGPSDPHVAVVVSWRGRAWAWAAKRKR